MTASAVVSRNVLVAAEAGVLESHGLFLLGCVEASRPIFLEIAELASPDMYDVSMTAAALRYVETTHEACALICSRDGVIEWVSKSQAFGYRIPWKNDAVPPGSMSNAVFNGEQPGAETKAGRLDPYTWLENEQRRPVELFESTLAISRRNLRCYRCSGSSLSSARGCLKPAGT